MIIFDSFKERMQLWKTPLMKDVLTKFKSFQIRTGSTYDASVNIVCSDKMLTEHHHNIIHIPSIERIINIISNKFTCS